LNIWHFGIRVPNVLSIKFDKGGPVVHSFVSDFCFKGAL
jgi:hypothetical protein